MVVHTRVLLLGGSGRFGEYAARCLVRSDIVSEIGLAGRNQERLKRRVTEIGDKTHSVLIDIQDIARLASLAKKYDIVVNAAGPEWEALLPALRAAIDAGVNYCDLGADARVAEKQLELDPQARDRGVVAVVGIGFDPGLDNLLTMHALKQFDSVDDIKFCFRLALPDELLREAVNAFSESGYVDSSWQLVMNNVKGPVRMYRDGSWVSVNPLEQSVEVEMPDGSTMSAYPVEAPELITIPRYVPEVRNVSCVFTITPPQMSELVYREAERISRGEVSVKEASRSFLETLAEDRERWLTGDAAGWDMRVVMTGRKGGRLGRYACWPVRVASTSTPLAVAAMTILRGDVSIRGVFPPEECFEPMPFFEEVARYMPPENQDKPLYGESMKWTD